MVVAFLGVSPAIGQAGDGSSRFIDAIPELVLAAMLLVVGFLSLRKWLRVRFRPSSTSELLLYSSHVASRVGIWFALAGFFVGYAVVDEPQSFGWYVFVLIGLASIQLLSSFYLWRSPPSPRRGEDDVLE